MKQLTKAELAAEVARLQGKNTLLEHHLHGLANERSPAHTVVHGAYTGHLYAPDACHGGYVETIFRSHNVVQFAQASLVYLEAEYLAIRDSYSEDEDYRSYACVIRSLYNWRSNDWRKREAEAKRGLEPAQALALLTQ